MEIKSGLILDDKFELRHGTVKFDKGNFCGIEYDDGVTGDNIIIPGLIDIHTHGCAGEDPMNAGFDGFDKMSRFMAENGTTTFLPTLLTDDINKISVAAVCAAEAAKKGVSGANIPGVHLEGPYFSEECIGANNVDYIRKPNIAETEKMQSDCGGFIKVISMDPTLEGGIEFIKYFKDKIKISLGHTAADFNEGQAAIEAGASNITHSFNGMKSMHHRNPNMLCAVFNSDVYMEIISDGFHVHPEMVKLAYKLAGKDRLVFITDSLSSMGAAEGVYDIGGMKTIVKNGEARLEDGTICGGMTPLYKIVKKAMSFGIPFESAVKCASINAAEAAGIDDKYGSITVGKSADFLVLDKNYELKETYIRGEKFNA